MPQELAFLPIQVSWPLSHGCDDVSLTYFVNSFPIPGHPPEAFGQQIFFADELPQDVEFLD